VYREKSLLFYTILMSYADEVQAVSIDEALVDVTQRVAELEQAPPELNERSDVAQDHAKLLAEDIRADMREATDCEGENQVYSRQYLYADTLNSNSQHRCSR
jgi:DNA repair protein REV1